MASTLPGFAISLASQHAVLDEGGESESASTIAATLGVSRATVYRVLVRAQRLSRLINRIIELVGSVAHQNDKG